MAEKSFAHRLADDIIQELEFIEKLGDRHNKEIANKHFGFYVDVYEALDKFLGGRDLPEDAAEEERAIDLARDMLQRKIDQMQGSINDG